MKMSDKESLIGRPIRQGNLFDQQRRDTDARTHAMTEEEKAAGIANFAKGRMANSPKVEEQPQEEEEVPEPGSPEYYRWLNLQQVKGKSPR
jgi:hypothetical protein